MADLQMRRMGRRALQGDPEAMAHEVVMRIRAGSLPRNHVIYAAHLGSPLAQSIEPAYQIVTACSNCRARREERTRRNRESRRTPLRETPRSCLACKGAGRTFLQKGLIRFVQNVEDVPHRLLVAWAADCAEHQCEALSPRNPHAFQGRYRLPGQPERNPYLPERILPMVRQYLETGKIDPLIYQSASVSTSHTRKLGVPVALATMTALVDIEGSEIKVRYHAAEIASDAYHAAGGTRDERTWQEECLIRYLLSYQG